MTTILHTADIHIDSDVHGYINPATGRNTAWESNVAVVHHLAVQAAEQGVDVFISSGDEFKTGRPPQEALLVLADALTPLAEARIPVLFLDGNHNRIGVTAGHRPAIWSLTEILRARGGEAYASAQPDLIQVGPVQVATLPWLNAGAVLGAHSLSPAEADRKVAEYAHATLEQLANRADPSIPLIMAGHGTVARASSLAGASDSAAVGGVERGSERELTHLFSEPILDVTALEQLPFAYGALGHIHTPQTVGSGIYRYSGSPNRLTFTDEPDIKGANLVTLGETLRVSRVATPARVMRTIDLGQPQEQPDIPEGALLRFILPEGETELDSTWRTAAQKAGARIAETKPRPKPAPPASTRPTLERTVDTSEALRTWAKNYSLLDEDTLLTAAQTLTISETERVR